MRKPPGAIKGGDRSLGGQDCYTEPSGAFTGDISAAMLKDAGASYVIVGHSERRTYHDETDESCRAKAEAALKGGPDADHLRRRDPCRARRRPARSLWSFGKCEARCPGGERETVVVAYEPIWAIGTGLTPTPKDVAGVHNGIRALLADMFGPSCGKIRLLYGGSVKPNNCQRAFDPRNVDGALVGGASLKATEFLAIAAAYR